MEASATETGAPAWPPQVPGLSRHLSGQLQAGGAQRFPPLWGESQSPCGRRDERAIAGLTPRPVTPGCACVRPPPPGNQLSGCEIIFIPVPRQWFPKDSQAGPLSAVPPFQAEGRVWASPGCGRARPACEGSGQPAGTRGCGERGMGRPAAAPASNASNDSVHGPGRTQE